MMKTQLSQLFCLAILVVGGCESWNYGGSGIQSAELSRAPKEYSWKKLGEINGACLMPKGWHYRKKIDDKQTMYQFTREAVSNQGEFLTGLTIHVYSSVYSKLGQAPSKVAEEYLRRYAHATEIVDQSAPEQVGTMTKAGGTFRRTMTLRGTTQPFLVNITSFANDKTGTLYFCVYGCPEKQWDEYLPTIATIGSHLQFNANI